MEAYSLGIAPQSMIQEANKLPKIKPIAVDFNTFG